MFNRRYVIIIFSVLAMTLLWPAAMVAAPPEPAQPAVIAIELPQAQDDELFPMYSSYDWIELSDGLTVPDACPPQDPVAIFKYGTRTIYSYAPVYAKKDLSFAILWYELDDNGDVVGDEPIAVANFEGVEGDAIPFGALTLNQAASGNVGVIMAINDGSGWLNAAFGVYIIAKKGVTAPQPGKCPFE